ncbi:hypothetical protein COA01_23220 [Bacillus cereus]|uniref:hypothetical protein n=1 Tax=Bacillus cereus TaxID=1396 RepID=UPI000BFB807D|nr:hypothetical protein [Bacillus cereus]PGP18656.1 hypothetical protein COA01_23220 [Bacillus cereus]
MNNEPNEKQENEKFEELSKQFNIPEFIVVYEAAEILNVPVKEVRRRCVEQEIKAHQRFPASGKWLIETKQFMNHENWDKFVEKRAEIKEKSLRFAQKMIEILDEDDNEVNEGGNGTLVFNKIEREILEEGRQEGRWETLLELVRLKLSKGKTPEQIQEDLFLSREQCLEMIGKVQGKLDTYTEILFGDEIRAHQEQTVSKMIEQGWANERIMEIYYEFTEEKIEELREKHKNQE